MGNESDQWKSKERGRNDIESEEIRRETGKPRTLLHFVVRLRLWQSGTGNRSSKTEREMSRGAAGVPTRTRVAAGFAVVLISLTVVAHCSNNDSEVRCSKICVAENCNSVGIRYGKFCGVGWTGCPGEKPCDDLDACCKIHDECVTKKGLTNVKCHEKFKSCIKRVQKSGKVGFSRVCPYKTAVPTMVQGMDLAILLSQFGNSKAEL